MRDSGSDVWESMGCRRAGGQAYHTGPAEYTTRFAFEHWDGELQQDTKSRRKEFMAMVEAHNVFWQDMIVTK